MTAHTPTLDSLLAENERLREALRNCSSIMRDYRQVWANPEPYDTAMNEAAALSEQEGK